MTIYDCKIICKHSENRSIIGIFAPVQEIIDVCNKRSYNTSNPDRVEFMIRLSEDDYPIKDKDGFTYMINTDEIISALENMTKPREYKTHGYGWINEYSVYSNWIELYCKDENKPDGVFPGDYPCKCLIEELSIHDYRHIDVEKYKDKIVENPTYGHGPCIDKANVGKVLIRFTLLVGAC